MPDNDEPKKQRQLGFMGDEIDNHNEDTQLSRPRRIGMSAGKAKFPDDINKYDDEVARLFGVSNKE